MLSPHERDSMIKLTFWQIYRLIFAIISLYLIGVAFYRWDGFRYYASFMEFLPAFGLLSILWSIMAVLITVFVWVLIKSFQWFRQRFGMQVGIEHVPLFFFFYIILFSLYRFNKQYLFLSKTKVFLIQVVTSVWNNLWNYKTFSEFLPQSFFVFIICSAIAVAVIIVLIYLFRIVERICLRIGWKVKTKNQIFVVVTLFLLISLIAGIRKFVTYQEQKTLLIDIAIFLFALLFTAKFHAFATDGFRNMMNKWMRLIIANVTPLIWIFGIWVLISVPIVFFKVMYKQTNNSASQKFVQSTEDQRKRPNIIFLSFDALTALDMSLYGYKRQTTPFMSEFSNSASVFTKAEAESNNTAQTTPSMMTGKRVWSHNIYHEWGFGKDVTQSMPALLKENGYYNMAFVVNKIASVEKLGISKSFDIAPPYIDFVVLRGLIGEYGYIRFMLSKIFDGKILNYDWFLKDNYFLLRIEKFYAAISANYNTNPYPIEKVFDRFLTEIDNKPPEPYFTWIHVMPPHYPYLPPEPFMGMFDSSRLFRWIKPEKDFLDNLGIIRARYDEFIRYCDKQFEELIKELEARGLLDDTIIIISSDHGESFEHGYIAHFQVPLYEQITNIPLIIKEPGQNNGRIIHDLVEQIDIPATILELAHIQVPPWMEGRSLVPLMRGNERQSEPLFSMALERNPSRGQEITKGQIAVWKDDYKLIHDIEGTKSLLFNLKQDPYELNNLFDKEPGVAEVLLNLINKNLIRANERIRRKKQRILKDNAKLEINLMADFSL